MFRISDKLPSFKTRSTQMRLRSKIGAKFRTFSPPVISGEGWVICPECRFQLLEPIGSNVWYTPGEDTLGGPW